MSPIKEARYVHSLITILILIKKVQMGLYRMEENANYLKQLIIEENQIDMFEP